MSLTGDVNTLALADLVQVSVLNRRTCQIHVIGPHAEGDLFIEGGQVVHAWWGDLGGSDAVYAMLNTADVGFHVRVDVAAEERTIRTSWQELVMEAARRQDHGSVPRPRARSSDRWRVSDGSELTPNGRRPRLGGAGPITLGDAYATRQERSGPPRALWLAAALLLAGSALALIWRYHGTAASAGAAAAVGATLTPVLDADALIAPGDERPTLLDGAAPTAPRSEWAITPTIICRVTIDSDGSVRQSHIYRSRLELAAYEDAALAALPHWRFRPARHAGRPVAVTINWPVTFGAAADRPATLLRIKGSDTMGGALAPAWVDAYRRAHGESRFSIQALGSKTAFVGLFDGSADLGASSRPVNAEELKQAARLGVVLREFVVAYDGVAVIVHSQNTVAALSLEQIGRIFSGAVRDWSELGGAPGRIRVISRPTYSGTHSFFKDKVLRRGDAKRTDEFAPFAEIIEDNRALVRAVAEDVRAVAYVGSSWVDGKVRALGIQSADGKRTVAPEPRTIRDGSYPIYRPLLFYTRGAPRREIADFLAFVVGPDGQALVEKNGFVPIDAATPIAVAADGEASGGAALEPLRVAFAPASAQLSPAARAKLGELRATVPSTARLLVVGHSDSGGNRAENGRLSQARAERVGRALVALGFGADAVQVEADSADAPLASNDTLVGRRQNRRVDVIVLQR